MMTLSTYLEVSRRLGEYYTLPSECAVRVSSAQGVLQSANVPASKVADVAAAVESIAAASSSLGDEPVAIPLRDIVAVLQRHIAAQDGSPEAYLRRTGGRVSRAFADLCAACRMTLPEDVIEG